MEQKYWVAITLIGLRPFSAWWLTSSCGRAVVGVVCASGQIGTTPELRALLRKGL
jgi:hypothetical protein